MVTIALFCAPNLIINLIVWVVVRHRNAPPICTTESRKACDRVQEVVDFSYHLARCSNNSGVGDIQTLSSHGIYYYTPYRFTEDRKNSLLLRSHIGVLTLMGAVDHERTADSNAL